MARNGGHRPSKPYYADPQPDTTKADMRHAQRIPADYDALSDEIAAPEIDRLPCLTAPQERFYR